MADRPLLGGINDSSGYTPQAKPAFVTPLLYSLISGIGPLVFGYTLGFTSPIGTHLQDAKADGGLGLSKGQDSFFGAIVNIGAILGAVVGGILLDRIGRKFAITFATIPYAVGYVLIFLAHTYPVLQAGRFLTGVGVGVASLAVPVYISEIAPSEYRGGLGTINQLAVTLGVLFVYAIGTTFKWRVLALVGAILSATLFVLSFLLPRTATFCMKQGKEDQAYKSLQHLRGKAYSCDSEIRAIEANLDAAREQGGASFMDLFRGAASRAMIVGVGLMVFQQFSGINSVIFFSGNIFRSAGFSNANLAALIVGIVQVIVTGTSCFIVDKSGRRSLLMVAGIGMAASLVALGYYFYLKGNDEQVSNPLALISVIIYIAFFSLGLGAIPWLMMSEIFPANVRGMGASVATLLNWTFSFIITETFQTMIDTFSEEGVFWFYAAVCVAGVLFVLKVPPETKGRTLEQIEDYFAGRDKSAGGAGEGKSLVQLTALLAGLYLGVSIIFTTL